MAERIGNLLGRLKFSDDQLQRTHKGLKDSGVAIPNFGNVGRDLAKEINEEPEAEVETEDERKSGLGRLHSSPEKYYRSRPSVTGE
jgi:Ras GTPase-activating-like protein IQGAP2/3